MKFLLPIFFWLWPAFALSQANDTSITSNVFSDITIKQAPNTHQTSKLIYKPEILTSGFIDVVNNGQLNASARFIRLYIGEPGKLSIPLSIYSGVSSDYFQNQQNFSAQPSNDQLITNFINPLSGLANISVDGIVFFNKKEEKVTRSGFLYHCGVRVLTGYKAGPVAFPYAVKPVNFLNSFGTAGLYFQTGAWERNNKKNVGVFWLAGRYIMCKTGVKQLKEILPDIKTNGFYHGWSLGWGVEINSLVNIKVVYYKYFKPPEIDYSLPIYQFSFNYSLR